MKRFGGKTSSWLLRHAEYLGENLIDQAIWEMEAILPEGKEIVLKSFEVVNSSFQVLPPKRVPICFARAVIGLGSQCGLSYCVHSTPTEVYQEYSQQIQQHYWPSPERWRVHLALREMQDRIKRDESLLLPAGDRSLAFSPTKCIQTARYYNFDPHKSTGPEQEEPLTRQGQQFPDSIQSHRHTTTATTATTILPVVAILQREGTRSVLNLDKVISTIAETRDFRLKVISYDFGCGIPETAYLMRDVHILISPHGNALGGSLWMPTSLSSSSSPSLSSYFPTVISIDSTRYHENWFQWTTTSMAQRFMIHRCGPAYSSHGYPKEINPDVCPLHRDINLAKTVLTKMGFNLHPETELNDLMDLTGAEFPLDLWEKYGGDKVNKFLIDYWKSLSRYADPARLLQILYQVRDENREGGKKSYLQLCRESKCCAPYCLGVMNRNIVGPLRAYDQDWSAENWGQLHSNEEQDAFVRSGQVLQDWLP